MPFELGLTAGRMHRRQLEHEWFVFERRRFRLLRSLSDLNGTDPHIHSAQPRRLLVELTNALVRADRQPTIDELADIYRFLRRGAVRIRAKYGGLYGARAFKDLVVLARDFVARELV
jgi:hypothetical protein